MLLHGKHKPSDPAADVRPHELAERMRATPMRRPSVPTADREWSKAFTNSVECILKRFEGNI